MIVTERGKFLNLENKVFILNNFGIIDKRLAVIA